MNKKIDFKKYEKYYNEDSLFNKALKYAQVAGIKVIYTGLLLYYAIQKPKIPKRIKATIIGGLGYFILPLDFIYDLIPGLGYTDDAAVLAGALLIAALYIDKEVKLKARKKLKDFFGDINEDELKDVDKSIAVKEDL